MTSAQPATISAAAAKRASAVPPSTAAAETRAGPATKSSSVAIASRLNAAARSRSAGSSAVIVARRADVSGGVLAPAAATAIQDSAGDAVTASSTRLAALRPPAAARTRGPRRSASRAMTACHEREAERGGREPGDREAAVRCRNSSRRVSGIMVCAARATSVPAKARRTGRTVQAGP